MLENFIILFFIITASTREKRYYFKLKQHQQKQGYLS
jgi:hypothetical protein